jgi:hypothetical protein
VKRLAVVQVRSGKVSPLSNKTRVALSSTQTVTEWVVKREERDAEKSHASSAEVMSGRAVTTSPPYILMIW